MKYLHLITSISLFFCLSLKAEEKVYERVYLHTDKDCYLAGEDVLLKFYTVNSNFKPSLLSKVGYVEISDTKRPWSQLKVALEKGQGAGTVKLPAELPTGIYRLTGYTRYMRNEGEAVFFKKQIAVVNAGQPFPDPSRFTPVDNYKQLQAFENDTLVSMQPATIKITTGQNSYGNRSKVDLSLLNIPENTVNLVVSVSRNDSIAQLPEINPASWRKQVTGTFAFSGQWVPEYEGHIIPGRFVPEPKEELLANMAFVGNNIRYTNGQINPSNGTINFFTAGISGRRQLVTTAMPLSYEKLHYRVDLLSPFDESLPESLPVLRIYPDKKTLTERYTGVQLQAKIENDSLENAIRILNEPSFQPALSYNLDEYARFGTLSEILLEFVKTVYVDKVKGKRIIATTTESSLKTLVLLDGIPIYDHEDILRYNPANIKTIDIYTGTYAFGNEVFGNIVSFITYEGNLPFFRLSDESQLIDYDFPRLPSTFEMPDYSSDRIRNSDKPDFRHTLYWNPFVETANGQPVNLSFYTSDLCGEFKVTVEGITDTGEIIRGKAYFRVNRKVR
ncbi:MAG: hypothetical protein LBR52_04645 [Prevotellaceae bacterium]|jgi:hypothetical protein|nr:hypothetical protein [Prevotellaceae bacterium]